MELSLSYLEVLIIVDIVFILIICLYTYFYIKRIMRIRHTDETKEILLSHCYDKEHNKYVIETENRMYYIVADYFDSKTFSEIIKAFEDNINASNRIYVIRDKNTIIKLRNDSVIFLGENHWKKMLIENGCIWKLFLAGLIINFTGFFGDKLGMLCFVVVAVIVYVLRKLYIKHVLKL